MWELVRYNAVALNCFIYLDNLMIDKDALKKQLKLVKENEVRGSIIMGGVTLFLALFVFLLMITSTRSLINSSTFSPKNFPSLQNIPIESSIEIATPSAEQPQIGQKKYIVQKGEGLWQVSEKHYNDGNKYFQIYEANKDKMKSPEDIREGMELLIP